MRTGRWLDGFLAGMGRAARSLGLVLAGGDTTRNDAVSISITVMGEVERGKAVTRAGAEPGDVLYVSGALGRAQLGLELVQRRLGRDRGLRKALEPHLYPKARIELGGWLADNRVASAMIDVSDGLSTDLHRLCAASKVGANVYAGQVPRVEIPATIAKRLGKKTADPLKMALHGGDDYELLFTVPKRFLKSLRRAPGLENIHWIGAIERGSKILIYEENGTVRPLTALGWDPFRKK
jgi:thiamine-monophosphate kinase